MSKMIIYFSLFIPLLFLSTESSSIRGRNHKNDLVPFSGSTLNAMKKDLSSMKIVSKDPFIIQLQMPNSEEMEARAAKAKDKNRKRPAKKRVSKIKPLRKKNRKRRDLPTLKLKHRPEKLYRYEIIRAANETEIQSKNITKNSVNRAEILQALSSYPEKIDMKQSKSEEIKNIKDEEKINSGKTKKNNTSNRNFHKHHLSLPDRSKMVYPSTPKFDRHSQKYTYKDLMTDRERLEQKIKYIKNMLNVNDSAADDPVRVRRRSDSDKTANKIAKMFLTLSAMNGLHERRKSKCKDEDEDDDRVEDVWETERRNNPYRKNTSSNEERYKVKKWIEFMKNKRSSGKTCPCMGNVYEEDADAFPLERKLQKGHLLMGRGRSSEESAELYADPFYYSRDKINRNDNGKTRLPKSQDEDSKKLSGKNGKKKLELPFEDLELYRSRARKILQNAEEILDKIKEEEEKRLAAPNILMTQLKELTSRIHGDPRNNENDLIRKIQKNLGWGPLARTQENGDGTFLDNVKSFILDPYEKAKALTDESTKKLSSYLLRNLGKFQGSSEEQEMRNRDDKADNEALKIYFGEVPRQEDKPLSANLAKEESRTDDLSKNQEELQNWENTLSEILSGGEDTVNKINNWDPDLEKPSQQETEDIIKEKQKKLNDYKDQSNKKPDAQETLQLGEEIAAESKPESFFKEERVVDMKLNQNEAKENNQDVTESSSEKDEKRIKGPEDPATLSDKTAKESDIVENKPFRGTEGTFQEKEGENNVTPSPDMQEEEEFEKEIEEIVKNISDKKGSIAVEAVENSQVEADEERAEDKVAEVFHKEENEKGNEKVGKTASLEIEDFTSGEERVYDSPIDERVEANSDTSSPSIASLKDSKKSTSIESELDLKENVKLEEDVLQSNEDAILEKQQKFDLKQDEEELKVEENKSISENFREGEDSETEKDSPFASKELQRENEKDSLNEELTQKENNVSLENNAKTLPEFADFMGEAKQSSKEFSEPNPTKKTIKGDQQSSETLEDESKIEKEETTNKVIENNQSEEITRKDNEVDENLKAMLFSGENHENKEVEKIVSGSTEDFIEEDLSTPLEATLENQENSNEPLDNHRSSSKENYDYALLKESNSEDQKYETEKDFTDETVEDALENKSLEILGKEKNQETSLSAEKLTEVVDVQQKDKNAENFSDEAILNESNPEEVLESGKEEEDETPLRAVFNNQYSEDPDETHEYRSNEVNDNNKNLDKEGSNEENFKASWNKEDLEKDDEQILKADETDDISQKNQETFDPAKSEDVKSYRENQENNDETGSLETLDGVLDTQENLEEAQERNSVKVNKNKEIINEKSDEEATVRAQTPDEFIDHKKTSQELLKPLSNEEIEGSEERASEETLKKTHLDENIQDEYSITENSDEKGNFETLKADKENQESSQEDKLVQRNLFQNKPDGDENLETVLKDENQESLEEKPEETLKAVKVDQESEQSRSQEEKNSEVTLKNQDNKEEMKDEVVLKEANIEESEENMKADDHAEANIVTHNQIYENGLNLDEDEDKKNEEDNDDVKILLKKNDFEEEMNNLNPNDETFKSVSSEQDQENLEDNYENLKAENPQEDRETPFRSAGLEDAFDNKIEYETPLKGQSLEENSDAESIKDVYENERGDTLRAENLSHDLNNQIDEENENETILQSRHLDPESPNDINDGSYEAMREEHLEAETPQEAQNPEDANFSLETFQDGFSTLGDPKKPDAVSKSLKASQLKVPESIGKIMKDLEGKEKTEITSIQNLNPDKIDHMLDKIGEAEQQNLLESDEVDCKKECACAEEMTTRSRNIGRYEIVKDFLHWVKDLHLNRVLSDD